MDSSRLNPSCLFLSLAVALCLMLSVSATAGPGSNSASVHNASGSAALNRSAVEMAQEAVILQRAALARRYLLSGRLQWGDPTCKEIALTFDDGPHPPFTPGLLALLKRLDVHATFFVVGRKVDQDPQLLQQIASAGHEIANHTYHHFNLKQVPAELVESEMRLDNDAIRRACGQTPRFFRPSGGPVNADVVLAARRCGMTMALWTDDPGDYDTDLGAAIIETRLLHHVRAGAIILLHDGMPQTEAMLPDFVERMRRNGYRFVTLSEMYRHLQEGADRTRVIPAGGDRKEGDKGQGNKEGNKAGSARKGDGKAVSF